MEKNCSLTEAQRNRGILCRGMGCKLCGKRRVENKKKKRKNPKFVLFDLLDDEAYLFDTLDAATKEAQKYILDDKFDPEIYFIAEIKIVRKVKREAEVINC